MHFVEFWFGYLITYWCFNYDVSGKHLLRYYDITKILYGFEVYHSLNIEYAIDKIKEDCMI